MSLEHQQQEPIQIKNKHFFLKKKMLYNKTTAPINPAAIAPSPYPGLAAAPVNWDGAAVMDKVALPETGATGLVPIVDMVGA